MKASLLVMLLLTKGAMAEQSDPPSTESMGESNEQLPRVLYIIPWQEPEKVPSLHQALRSELDAMYDPLDREPFFRELGLRRDLGKRELQ
jgi:hypothetical protein